jgi:hypothetical protein
MVPFVRDADRKGLLAISQEVKELAGKVRSHTAMALVSEAPAAAAEQQSLARH